MLPLFTIGEVLTAAQVRGVLAAAAAGPALPGTSSWRIEQAPARFELHADSSLWSPGTDVAHRRALIACGAALLNLRVAVRALGVTAVLELLPDAARPDVLGALHIHGSSPATPADLALGRAQAPSVVTRRPPPVLTAEPVRNALRRAARTEGAWLATIGPRQRISFEDLSAALTPPHQLVAVIATLHDGPLAQLQAGHALQRVLLTATTMGLPAELEPRLVEGPTSRQVLRELLGRALWPHMVVRVDYAESRPEPS